VPVRASAAAQGAGADAKVLLDLDVGGWGTFQMRWRVATLTTDGTRTESC